MAQYVSVLMTSQPLFTLIVGEMRLIGQHVVTEGSKPCGSQWAGLVVGGGGAA